MLKLKNISNNSLTINDVKLLPGCTGLFNNTSAVQLALKNKAVVNLNDNHTLKDIDKEKLKEVVFKFYMNQSDKDDLEYLKIFYKFICFTNRIQSNVIHLIDSVNTTQQLRQILVNDIYNYLIDEIMDGD